MERIFRLLFNVREFRLRCDDDSIDRLSKRYTTSLFLFFAMLVTSKTYVGEPIRCWCPAQFTDSHKHYTNNICWVSQTYYVAMDKQLEQSVPEYIGYYQWVPFILLSQAVVCYLPSVFWAFLHKKSGLDLLELIEASDSFRQRHQSPEQRSRTRAYIVYSINRYLMKQKSIYDYEGKIQVSNARKRVDVEEAREPLNRVDRIDETIQIIQHHDERTNTPVLQHPTTNPLTSCLSRYVGRCYLTLSYLFIKMFYATNAIGQILLLDVFLGQGYKLYGVEVLKRMLEGTDWTFLERFPRVTMCDFIVRAQAGSQHRYVVQCALSINLFNEKIFLVVWFWLAAVCCLTLVDLLKWTYYFGPHCSRLSYTSQLIDIAYTCTNDQIRSKAPHTRHDLSFFIKDHLQTDGIYVCHLLEDIVGRTTTAEIVRALWEKYSLDMSTRIQEVASVID